MATTSRAGQVTVELVGVDRNVIDMINRINGGFTGMKKKIMDASVTFVALKFAF